MIQKLKTYFSALAITMLMGFSGALVPALGSSAVAATGGIQSNLCQGSSSASGDSQGKCNSKTSTANVTSGIQKIAKSVVTIFSIIVGAVSVVMLIYGGLRYITSGGATEKVGDAKKTIIYAIVGLVVVALAQVIVNVAISATTTATDSFN